MTRRVCWTFLLHTDGDVAQWLDLDVAHADKRVTATLRVYPTAKGPLFETAARGAERSCVVNEQPMPRFVRSRFLSFADEALRAYEAGDYAHYVRSLTNE